MSTYYSRALFPSTNMNGNKLTNSEIKGYASRSRVGGQFAVVGKSCFNKRNRNSLKYCATTIPIFKIKRIPNIFFDYNFFFIYNSTLLFSFFILSGMFKIEKIEIFSKLCHLYNRIVIIRYSEFL